MVNISDIYYGALVCLALIHLWNDILVPIVYKFGWIRMSEKKYAALLEGIKANDDKKNRADELLKDLINTKNPTPMQKNEIVSRLVVLAKETFTISFFVSLFFSSLTIAGLFTKYWVFFVFRIVVVNLHFFIPKNSFWHFRIFAIIQIAIICTILFLEFTN